VTSESQVVTDPRRNPQYVSAGYLVKSFQLVLQAVRVAAPASKALLLQQVLREANAVCLDYARFALAYAYEANGIEAATTSINQLSLSKAYLPAGKVLDGLFLAYNIRSVSLDECICLDQWLTWGLTDAVYGRGSDDPELPLPSTEQVRLLIARMIKSGELAITAQMKGFVHREIFLQDPEEEETEADPKRELTVSEAVPTEAEHGNGDARFDGADEHGGSDGNDG